MLTVWLWLGLCALASCSITCPDGRIKCKDKDTCCLTDRGYKCCPYPNAECCEDLAHCCPSGFSCNLVTQMCEKRGEPWMRVPLLQKEAGTEQDDPAENELPREKSSVVYCDSVTTCPDGYTCCRHPRGGWTCCPYSPARCCLDGFHCCPYGYDCDYTYTHCIRQGLHYPFSPREPLPAQPAALVSAHMAPLTAAVEDANVQEMGAIRCDFQFYCPKDTSCCKGSNEHWTCCPYQLGSCCADHKHCCPYGTTCDPDSQSCIPGPSVV